MAFTNCLRMEGLKEFIDQQNPIGANEFLKNVVSFFNNPQLTNAELEYALDRFLDEAIGTPTFLLHSIQARKMFKDSNVIIFNLWARILEENVKSINSGAYTNTIVKCCMKFIVSDMVSTAKERELAAKTMRIVVEKQLLDADHTADIVCKILTVFNLKNIPEMFASEVFRLLGTIANIIPECLSAENSERVKDVFLRTLENILLDEEGIQNRILAGAMEGFSLYLNNFAPSPEENPDIYRRIYNCVKKSSDPPDCIKQKMPFLAALGLFEKHTFLFMDAIYKDFNYWHNCLNKCMDFSNIDYRKRAMPALVAFHKVVADKIKSDEENGKTVLSFLLGHFQSVLQSITAKPHEYRTAIEGFGLFSFSCKRHFPEILNNIISLIIQRSELITICDDSELKQSLEHFPNYVLALSTIVQETQDPTISELLIENIRNIVVRLIRDFHYLSKAHTSLVVSSLINSFYKIFLTDACLLERLLDKAILPGVIWTCSHKLIYDASRDWHQTDIDWKDNITYKSYIPLWQGLLDEKSMQPDKRVIVKMIYDHLMHTFFTLLEKLDLRTKKRIYINEDGKNEEFHFCDPNVDLCPVKPKDFHIFLNLVEFYHELFASKYQHLYFRDWMNDYCINMIRLAMANPLVSGFFKLLRIGLNIANYINDFSNDDFPELQIELGYFLKHLIVKCQRVSGELQIAILELILNYPVSFYSEFLIEIIPIFQIALDLGKSMMWLARMTIACLDSIVSHYSNASHDLHKLFKSVFPRFDSYLQGKNVLEELSVKVFCDAAGQKNNYKTKVRRTNLESDLYSVQTEILSLLGKLDATNVALVVSKDNDMDLVKWDIDTSISLPLLLSNMNLRIRLDDVVPRICHLSVVSPDRKTKVACCELVHAMILYLLGTHNHKGRIWKELCTRMLLLGADTDTTVQNMFKPLLLQVMHFMSRYENLNCGVDILMDTLLEGICNGSNTTLRDLSARCLREFVEWSIKQTTPEQLAASPASIQDILDKLKMYSFESNANRRVGASLAFNNLYRVLRENETICDLFFIDLLHVFCMNFKLSEELSSLSVCSGIKTDLDIVSISLDHVVRVLRERNYLYNKSSLRRRVPINFKSATLRDSVSFLICEASTRLFYYRQKCIAMAVALAPYVDGHNSVKSFLAAQFSIKELLEICEGPSDGYGIRARPDLSNIKNAYDSETIMQSQIYNWMEHFLGALVRYIWLLGDAGLPHPEKLFVDGNILIVIPNYLNQICFRPMTDLINEIDPNDMEDTTSTAIYIGTEVLSKVESIKCDIIDKLLAFLIVYLSSGCALKIHDKFWSIIQANFAKLIVQLIFERNKINAGLQSFELLQNSQRNIEKFLRQLKTNCPDKEFVSQMHMCLLNSFNSKFLELKESVQEILSSDRVSEKRRAQVEGIYFTLKNLNLLGNAKMTNLYPVKVLTRQLLTHLFHGVKQIKLNKETIVKPPSDVKQVANRLMCIVLLIDDLFDSVVELICDNTTLTTLDMNARIFHGEHFFNIYRKAFCQESTSGFISALFKKYHCPELNDSRKNHLFKATIEILDYLQKCRRHEIDLLNEVFTICLDNLSQISVDFLNKTDDLLFMEYVTVMVPICNKDLTIFRDKAPDFESWIVNRLKQPKASVEQKSRVIALLPLVIGPSDFDYPTILNSLEEVQRLHMPLISTEFNKNSLEEVSLKGLFKSLLSSLVSSRSFVLLQFIIKCTALEEKHIVEYMIHEELKNFAFNLTEKQQGSFLDVIFKITLNVSYEPNVRLIILKRFLLPIFVNCHENALVVFFSQIIKQIDLMITTNYAISKSGLAVEHALVSRIIAFSLIEQFFCCVSKELYMTRSSPIAIALLGSPKDDTELIREFTKKSYYARKEIFTTDDKKATELFRQYQCAAYKALCSLVSNTQNKLEIYSKFLFEENINKNELIWVRMVDCSPEKNYTFGQGQQRESCKIKNRIVAIRKLNEANVRPEDFSIRNTTKLLQTQNIHESSLSQDVSAIDMNLTRIRTHYEALARNEIHSRNQYTVELEKHDVNQHEIMAMVCGVVKHMFENNINPVNLDNNVKRSPRWIVSIAQRIASFETPKNVRVFLAQFVTNCNREFEQFAHILFDPILRIVLDWCVGTELNFFNTDLITMLLEWTSNGFHKPTSTSERYAIAELLRFLMRNAWNEKKEIFKYNIEIIRCMIIYWRDCVEVDANFMLDILRQSDREDSKANEFGIILYGLLLQHDIVPWSIHDRDQFINVILRNIQNNYISVYQPAAYSLGLTLATLQKQSTNDTSYLNEVRELVLNELKALNNKKHNHSEKVLMDLLYGIHKAFPDILDNFRELIAFRLPSAIGVAKKIYMEMLLSRIDSFDENDLYHIIVSIGMKDLLRHNDYQLLALHIFNRSLPKLKARDTREMFESVELSLNSPRVECREIAYEICIYIARNSVDIEMKSKTVRLLLKDVIDEDENIAKRIYQFWSQEASISDDTHSRIATLLQDYASDSEKHFLGRCVQLLLEPAVQNPESKRQIFEYETDRDVKFYEYDISTKSKTRSGNTLPPLFADSQLFRNHETLTTDSLVIATNRDNFFEPTQDPTFISQAPQSFTINTQGSLPLSGLGTQLLDRRSQKITSNVRENVNQKTLNLFRRRFVDESKRDKILRVIDFKQRKYMDRASNKKSKTDNVILYRRYRFGDYPDLLINSLAFLLPLQALVQRDTIIAKQLFIIIFNAVVAEMADDANAFISQIDRIIQFNLMNSKTYESSLFSTFLELTAIQPSAFNLSPNTVALISKLTKKFFIGAIYLENKLKFADWDGGSDSLPSKLNASSSVSSGAEESHWLQLADIYSSLKEYDIVAAIFSDKIRTDTRLAEAIELKANRKFEEAITKLLQVISRNVYVEHYYAYNCYYECFMELGNWSELSQVIRHEVEDFEELWTDDYNKNFLLPKFIQCELQLVLNGHKLGSSFLRELEKWIKSADKVAYMKNNFCEELMMFHISNQDFGQARVYCENYLKNFLSDWSTTNNLCTKLKVENLLNAQKAAEIDQYARLLLENFDTSKAVDFLLMRWNNFSIDPSDSLPFWNSLLAYRRYIAAIVSNRLDRTGENSKIRDLKKSVYKMEMQIFDAAIQQKNVAMAEHTINSCICDDSILSLLQCDINKMKLICVKGENSSSAESLESAWIGIEDILSRQILWSVPALHMDSLLLKSQISSLIYDKWQQQQIDEQTFANLLAQETPQPTSAVMQRYLEHSFEALQECVHVAQKVHSEESSFQSTLSDVHYKLALFASTNQEREEIAVEVRKLWQKTFITSVFQAMRHGSTDAKQLFPCVLQLSAMEDKHDSTFRNLFREQSVDVPEWTFLPWIPQILSRFRFIHECYLDDIVKRIASKYPNALRYPFNVCYDQIICNSRATFQPPNRLVVAHIIELLHDNLSEKFVKSMKYFAIPEGFLISHINELMIKIQNTELTQEQYQQTIKKFIATVYPDDNSIQGSAYRRIAYYREKFENLSRLTISEQLRDILKSLWQMKEQLRKIMLRIDKNVYLSAICPWLASYQWCGDEDSIEIPGQYNRYTISERPSPLLHAKIVKFESKMQFIISQRFPLRTVIYGSDAKSHVFLVKYGENLTQDQRIQQLLNLMSQKLSKNSNGRKQGLFIRTYQVVPFDQNCGLLRWLDDTTSLYDFIVKQISRHDVNSKLQKIIDIYMAFIRKPAGNTVNDDTIYGKAVSTYSRNKIIQNFRSLENMVEYDIIKKALSRMSVSTESFYVLRYNFATSLASMSVAHWILGVGDRHLKNILISCKDATLAGIDFGYAFGAAIRDLSVPELLPFRLTPHLVHAMEPMRTSGLISKSMSHSLRIFCQSKRILMACMEVFIREPNVNWLYYVQRQETHENSSSDDELSRKDSEASDWEPKDRIDIARCKLEGFSPMHLLVRELKAGKIAKNLVFLRGYIDLVRGDEQFNIRARLPEQNLSVEEQVKCLIDLATDPALLGISFVGFFPWI